MSFYSTDKPLSEWKWYIRKRDLSVHQSPDPVEDGIEVASPPGKEEHYTWDWANNQWMIDTPKLKRWAMRKAQTELDRLKKFNDLEAPEKSKIQEDLNGHRKQIRSYIKNFDPLAAFPESPVSLTDENFYELEG